MPPSPITPKISWSLSSIPTRAMTSSEKSAAPSFGQRSSVPTTVSPQEGQVRVAPMQCYLGRSATGT